jgi:SAM-dependent methyltransferase
VTRLAAPFKVFRSPIRILQRGLSWRVRAVLRWIEWFYWMQIIKTRCGLESVRNFLIDRKYGGSCGGAYQTRFPDTGARGTSSVDYYQLPKLFHERNGVVIRPSDVLVDVGCGKGRVINWWLSRGLRNRLIGIELDERFAAPTAARLRKYPNVSILCGNALDHIPPEGTLFFLFNPFTAPIVEAFKDRVIEICGEDADVTILYSFCVHGDVFRNDPRWVVEPVSIKTFWPAVVVRRARPLHSSHSSARVQIASE